jgi:ABC-type oligopeptide transport system ATPase subunit
MGGLYLVRNCGVASKGLKHPIHKETQNKIKSLKKLKKKKKNRGEGGCNEMLYRVYRA